jgi:hypothetical protein
MLINTPFSSLKFNQLKTIILIVLYILVALIYQQQLFDEILKTNILVLFTGMVIVFDYIFSPYFTFRLASINKTTLLAFLLVLFIMLNSLLIRNALLIGALFNVLIGAVIAVQLNNFKFKPWLSLIPFWFIVTYILYRLTIDLNPENVFVNSRNYVSFYLIIMVVPYYLISYKHNIKVSLIPSLLTLGLSIYCLGRSGIAASLLILFSTFSYKYKGIKALVFLLILGLIFSYFIANYFSIGIKDAKRFSDLSNFTSDRGRSEIVSAYIDNMKISNFLFGVDVDIDLQKEMRTYGHLHSSLINFHSAIGVGSLIFGYFLFIKLKLFLKTNIPILLLLLSIIVRASTDVGLLFAYFDYVFWIFLFINYNSDNTKLKLN